MVNCYSSSYLIYSILRNQVNSSSNVLPRYYVFSVMQNYPFSKVSAPKLPLKYHCSRGGKYFCKFLNPYPEQQKAYLFRCLLKKMLIYAMSDRLVSHLDETFNYVNQKKRLLHETLITMGSNGKNLGADTLVRHCNLHCKIPGSR